MMSLYFWWDFKIQITEEKKKKLEYFLMGMGETVESNGGRAGPNQPDKEAVDGISSGPGPGRCMWGTHILNALTKKSHKSYFR